MPNQLHAVVVLNEAEAAIKSKQLARSIGAFKTVSSKAINQACETSSVWGQRDFYKHIDPH
jgi:hypothetical protein